MFTIFKSKAIGDQMNHVFSVSLEGRAANSFPSFHVGSPIDWELFLLSKTASEW